MKKDEKRQTLHHLLVFDSRKIKLENHTFSGDSTNIVKGTNPMDTDITLNEKTDAEVTCYLLGMAVHWRIAVEGGKQLTDTNQPKMTTFARFAKRGTKVE